MIDTLSLKLCAISLGTLVGGLLIFWADNSVVGHESVYAALGASGAFAVAAIISRWDFARRKSEGKEKP